jgi:hypothetical protein
MSPRSFLNLLWLWRQYVPQKRRYTSNTPLTYILTPWSRVFLEKLTDLQLVKKFPAFYGTRGFITAFTNTHHMSLSLASSIQYISTYPVSWRSALILSSLLRLGLPSLPHHTVWYSMTVTVSHCYGDLRTRKVFLIYVWDRKWDSSNSAMIYCTNYLIKENVIRGYVILFGWKFLVYVCATFSRGKILHVMPRVDNIK